MNLKSCRFRKLACSIGLSTNQKIWFIHCSE